MKKKLIKTIAILLTVMSIAISFTGCDNTQKTALDPKNDYVKLKYNIFGTRALVTGNKEVYEKFNKKLKTAINAELDINFMEWSEYSTKMPVILASNEEFDLMFTSAWLNSYSQNVSKNGLVELDSLLTKYAPNLLEKFDDYVIEASKINGKLYAIPNQQIMARQSGFVFRNDFLKKTGFDPQSVTKLSDLTPYFKALKDQGITSKQYEFSGLNQGYSWINVAQSLGWEAIYSDDIPGSIDCTKTGDVTVVNQFNTPEYREYYNTVRNWYKEGFFTEDSATRNRYPGNKNVISEVGTYKPVSWYHEAITQWDGFKDLAIAPYGEKLLNTQNIVATMTGISRTSKNPEKALMYINEINTNKELYNLLCYGLEGRDYEKVGDNKIELLPTNIYKPNTDWAYGDQFNAFIIGKDSPDDVWKQQKDFNDTALKSPILGFNFIADNVQTEIANCKAVTAEYTTRIKYGMLNEDEYAEFLKKLEAAGMDNILKEMQLQIDMFL